MNSWTWLRPLAGAAMLCLALPLYAPQVLAFPYHSHVGISEVWSEQPIDPRVLEGVLQRSAALVASSPLAEAAEPRRIFLTAGGWRWRWLAISASGAFGVTRAVGENIVVNRSDVSADRVYNDRSVGGTRTLSGVIAHETCHGMERRHFGVSVDLLKPAWLREGYCDHVAGESSLSEIQAAALMASGTDHPALVYYHGRRRVDRELAGNGGNVDALFAGH